MIPVHRLELSGSIAFTDADYTQTVPVPGDNTQFHATAHGGNHGDVPILKSRFEERLLG